MLAAISLLLAAGTAGVTGAEEQLQGRCRYSAAVQAHREDTVLVTCDAVTIDKPAGTGGIVFSQDNWDVVMIRFQGEWTGDRMAVSHLVLRNGIDGPAKGTCEVFRREGRVSAVSCLATMAGSTYAANFETPGIGN